MLGQCMTVCLSEEVHTDRKKTQKQLSTTMARECLRRCAGSLPTEALTSGCRCINIVKMTIRIRQVLANTELDRRTTNHTIHHTIAALSGGDHLKRKQCAPCQMQTGVGPKTLLDTAQGIMGSLVGDSWESRCEGDVPCRLLMILEDASWYLDVPLEVRING